MQPMLLKRAGGIAVSSYDYARRSGVSRFFSRYPERVHEIPFGVDTAFFSPGEKKLERFMIKEGRTSYLFVGGLDKAHAFKGVDLLLEAFAHLPANTELLNCW